MGNLNELEKLGLTIKESKVYLKLLEKGFLTANEIAKLTEILRQTVYETLESLKQKGLVSSFTQNKKKHFEASNPNKLRESIEEKKKIVDNLIPELLKIKSKPNIKPTVEFYEGTEGIKRIYNQILEDKPKELLEYGNSSIFIEIMKLYFIDNYITKRISHKINVKLITENNSEIKRLYETNKKFLRETRYLENINKLKTAGYIYNNKFIIIKFSPEPLAISIEDEETTKTQKEFFELLWKSAEEK